MSYRLRVIPGFTAYQVSSEGRIFSMKSGRWLKGRPVGPYLAVQLRGDDDQSVSRYTHEVVLTTFVGPRPEGLECRHLNGDPHDNRLENLAWGTSAENKADRKLHGTDNAGERHGLAKTTWEDVRAIRAAKAAGAKQKDLAVQFGLSPMAISMIVRNIRWKEENAPTTEG